MTNVRLDIIKTEQNKTDGKYMKIMTKSFLKIYKFEN